MKTSTLNKYINIHHAECMVSDLISNQSIPFFSLSDFGRQALKLFKYYALNPHHLFFGFENFQLQFG